MESTVVELSRYTASDTPSNSQWTNNISNSKKVTVNNGDVIQVKQCFIDTRQVGSGDIELVQDVQWTIEFGYYITNHGINIWKMDFDGEVPFQAAAPVDGQPYLLYRFGGNGDPVIDAITGKPLIDSFTINIPAGIYTRQYLAAFITRQMQGNPTPQNIELENLQFSSGNYTPQYNVGSSGCAFLQQTDPADPARYITSLNKPLFLAQGAEDLNQPNVAGFNVFIDNQGDYVPCCYFPFLRDVSYSNSFLDIIVSGADTGAAPKSNIQKTYYGVPYDLYDGCMAGSGQCALEYDVDGSSKFQWTYAHTPIINKGNEVSGVFLDTVSGTDIDLTTKTKFFNNFSGIVFFNTFTNLSPIVNDAPDGTNDPFFDQLGLNYLDMCYSSLPSNPILNQNAVPANLMNTSTTTGNGLESAIFFAKTTRNFNAIQNLANTTTINIYNYDLGGNGSTYFISKYNFNTSTTTVPINFSGQPISSVNNAGHYLVELICSYSNNEYINATQSYQVKAIVGTYYLSSDSFCLTNGPDSFVYEHRGEPINLSSITVRLLNPITKQEATNIGPNSTIYITITKEQPPPIPTPPPQKK